MELLDRPLEDLCAEARALRDEGHGRLVTYSPKVFIPLTKLCRDVCHYCTFARPPRRGERAYMTIDEALAVARAGEAAGWREALFTPGGAVHAGRQAGAPLQRGPRRARGARVRLHARLPGRRGGGGARGDVPAP